MAFEIDLAKEPELYRVGRGEQGVFHFQPYKSQLLPLWKFQTPQAAAVSIHAIEARYRAYKAAEDFVGMDMARKYLQMGYTRSMRYARHVAGRKYDARGEPLPIVNDSQKAEGARLFREAWQSIEADPVYQMMKVFWRTAFG